MSAHRGAEPRSTLEQVAARAGVSRATVSRVVNGRSTVDPKLVRKVEAAIAELNYVPNQAARSLMTRTTNTVALVATESDDRVFGDPFFSSVVRGAGRTVSAAGCQLTVFFAQSEEELSNVSIYLRSGHCDGVLLISEHGGHGLVAELAQAGVPVVIGGRPLDPSVQVSYVDHNNAAGAELATRHLLSRGRRRIATITGPQDMSAGVDRLEGFRRALGSAFDPELVFTGDFTSISGAEMAAEIVRRAADIDAIFAASDLMALGAMTALQRAGLRIPEDIAVVGFDDIALAAQSNPPLTTVRQATVDQGRRMAELLLSEMTQRRDGSVAAEGVILPVDLIVREST